MSTRLSWLEPVLQRLALEFADGLLAAAVRAPVADLGALLRDGAAFERELLRGVASSVAVERGVRARGGQRGGARAAARRMRARKKVAAAPRGVRAAPVGDADDGGAAAGLITDPASLLDVIDVTRPPPPPTRVRPRKREAPALRTTPDAPSLRPGERLQRTRSGGVVLTRGGK